MFDEPEGMEEFADARVNFDDLDEYDDLREDDSPATGSLGEVGMSGAMGQLQLPVPIDFQALSASEYVQEITNLRVWVAWFVEVMHIEAKVIPPCWEQHTNIVLILSALERHYKAAYNPMSSPVEASSFHQYAAPHLLQQCEAAHSCGFGTHKSGKVQEWADDINERGYQADAWNEADTILHEEYDRRVKVEYAKSRLQVIPGDTQ